LGLIKVIYPSSPVTIRPRSKRKANQYVTQILTGLRVLMQETIDVFTAAYADMATLV
jgi:hypothetical protein